MIQTAQMEFNMLKNSLSSLVIFSVMSVLNACSSMGIDKISERYNPPPERKLQQLANAKKPHVSELDGQPMNVIWNINSDVKDVLSLSENLKEGILHQLKNQGITIKGPQDKKTQHLIEEIERARKNSTELKYFGEQKVNYYVKASISKSSIKSVFSEPSWCPFCDEKRQGSCKYSLDAGLQIEVLSLPSLRRVKHYSAKEQASFKVDVFDRCQKHTATADADNEYEALHNSMTESLISCSGYALNKFLAPQAYIEKYFSDGKDDIYQISAGRAAGLKRGDEVDILRKKSSGYSHMGEAEVIAVKADKAFIEITDKALKEKVRQYDFIKVQFNSMLKEMSCSGTIIDD